MPRGAVEGFCDWANRVSNKDPVSLLEILYLGGRTTAVHYLAGNNPDNPERFRDERVRKRLEKKWGPEKGGQFFLELRQLLDKALEDRQKNGKASKNTPAAKQENLEKPSVVVDSTGSESPLDHFPWTTREVPERLRDYQLLTAAEAKSLALELTPKVNQLNQDFAELTGGLGEKTGWLFRICESLRAICVDELKHYTRPCDEADFLGREAQHLKTRWRMAIEMKTMQGIPIDAGLIRERERVNARHALCSEIAQILQPVYRLAFGSMVRVQEALVNDT